MHEGSIYRAAVRHESEKVEGVNLESAIAVTTMNYGRESVPNDAVISRHGVPTFSHGKVILRAVPSSEEIVAPIFPQTRGRAPCSQGQEGCGAGTR